jgi:hypothetical protein
MNIEHPTSNIEHPMFGIRALQYSMLDVGCLLAIDRSWMLDVVPLQVSRLCIAIRENQRAPRGFFRSADSFVRVFPPHRYLRADKAVRAPLVAATPRCAFAPLC